MTDTVSRRRIRKVLIANRGEIAVRILRGLREMGIRGAVVYSEPDRLGLPVLLADEAYPIGPAPSRESYLRGDAIVELAVRGGADAIDAAEDLASSYRAARSEAGASFGDDSVYMEKYIVEPRHVEIQVMGDLYGK